MEELENGSLSENDMPPGQEEEENPGQQEGPSDGNGQEPEPGDDTGHPDGEGQEMELQPVVVIEDGGTEEWREGITERLTELMKPADNTDVTERLDALIQMLTPEEQEGEPEPYAAAFSFDGYKEWDYPVTMEFEVYPWGLGSWMKQSENISDPEAFVARYEEITSLCQEGGTLKDFRVLYIYDCSGDDPVYDYEAQTPEPEPGPGDAGQDETTELLLSYLESIDNTIGGMEQAVVEYCQTEKDYQAEMLQMMAASTAADIFICIGVFAIFAALVWQWLLGRFK